MFLGDRGSLDHVSQLIKVQGEIDILWGEVVVGYFGGKIRSGRGLRELR